MVFLNQNTANPFSKSKIGKNSTLISWKNKPLISWKDTEVAPVKNSVTKSISNASTEGSDSEIEISEKLGGKLTTLLKYSEIYQTPPKTTTSDLAYNILGCKEIPGSNFSFYLARILKYTQYEDSIFIIATMLLKKAFDKIQGFDPKLLHK
jgi:hypothetical protein